MTEVESKEIIKKIETTYPEWSEVVMNLAERFMEEGAMKGLEKGGQKFYDQRAGYIRYC